MLSWPVLMKFKWMLGQGNVLVFSLTVRRLWKPIRLLKQRTHWYNSAKRRWTTFPPSILWGCFGSLEIVVYEEMKLPMSSSEGVHFSSLLDLNWPWGVCRQNIREKVKGWMDNQHVTMWRGLITTQRQAQKLISVPSLTVRKGYCPLRGHKPGLFPASLLDITPWEDIFT
jgi:hypothetical protein